MEIRIFVKIRLETEFDCIGPYPSERRFGGFLHDVANLTGHSEMPSSSCDVGFDEQNVATDGRPRQSDYNAGTLYTFFHFLFKLIFRRAEEFFDHTRCYDQARILAFQQTAGMFPADICNLPLEVSDTGLARVMPHDVMQGRILKFDLIGLQTTIVTTTGHEVVSGDLHLFLFGIAGQFDDFHTVSQRGWNRIENIRGRNEKYTREIESHIEVVITKRHILLRIENFQQCRCRISAEVRAQLVDLIEHEHRIARSRATNALDDLTGQGADICTPMTADLGLVAHASERDA